MSVLATEEKVQCSSKLPQRCPAAFGDSVMLGFDVKVEQTAMQHYSDSQLVPIYCVLSSTLPQKRKK